MSAVTSNMPAPGDWTPNDLGRFPEDGIRREIFDGFLHVTPSPSSVHQTLALLLGSALLRSCPDHLFVSQANDVVLSPNRLYAPDLLVVTFEAAKSKTGKFAADEVVLAAEIVSPSTRTIDSLTKPSAYAHAGIPSYWLIETGDGVTVSVYELNADEKIYEPLETFSGDDVIQVDRPWPIEIPLSTVRPRNL